MSDLDELVEFIASTVHSDLPNEVCENAKIPIQDFLGVALHGATSETGEIVANYVDLVYPLDTASVFNHGTSSPLGAAFANAIFGHCSALDDTFNSLIIHPTAPVLPSSLATTELMHGSGRDFLTGYIVGIETIFRVGRSMNPSHYEKGWHATGTIGSFGAVAASAHILDLRPEEIKHALGIVASSSSSLRKNCYTMTRSFHAGHAAKMGVEAALLANAGFTANEEIFSGHYGYGNVMTQNEGHNPELLSQGLGNEWAVFDIGLKAYPSATITNGPMKSLRAVMLENSLSPTDIDKVKVIMPDTFKDVLTAGYDLTPREAMTSIPFCLSAIMIEGDLTHKELTDEYLDRKKTKLHMEKVNTVFQSGLSENDVSDFVTRIEVETIGGEILVEKDKSPLYRLKGTDNKSKLNEKYIKYATSSIAEREAEHLATNLQNLEKIDNISEIGSLIQGKAD